MNKTIKVIDLLNKIANGEVVPKTILFWDKEYKFDDEYKCYMRKISEDIFDDFMDNNDAELDEFLNDTVEIIEDNDKTDEEAKPITKESIEALGYACGEIQKCFTSGWTKALENKPLKGNDKLEKIPYEFNLGYINTNDKDLVIKEINKTINGIYVDMNKVIDHINKIEEKLDEK